MWNRARKSLDVFMLEAGFEPGSPLKTILRSERSSFKLASPSLVKYLSFKDHSCNVINNIKYIYIIDLIKVIEFNKTNFLGYNASKFRFSYPKFF